MSAAAVATPQRPESPEPHMRLPPYSYLTLSLSCPPPRSPALLRSPAPRTPRASYLHLSKASLEAKQPLLALRHAEASLRAVPAPNPDGHALAARALISLAHRAAAATRGADGGGGGEAGVGAADGRGAADAPEASDAFERAATHAQAAVQADPSASEVAAHWSLLAEARSALHQWGMALPAFEAASKLSPADASAAINLGAALLQLRRPEEAAERFRRVLAASGEDASHTHSGGTHPWPAVQLAAMKKARHGLDMAMRALRSGG